MRECLPIIRVVRRQNSHEFCYGRSAFERSCAQREAISGLLSVALVTWLIRTPLDGDPDAPQRRFADLPATEKTPEEIASDASRWAQLRSNTERP